jgi:hypothetical protein
VSQTHPNGSQTEDASPRLAAINAGASCHVLQPDACNAPPLLLIVTLVGPSRVALRDDRREATAGVFLDEPVTRAAAIGPVRWSAAKRRVYSAVL